VAVAVTRLTLTRFRGYAAARLVTEPVPVVLTGLNGAGKTNLLEALSLLVPGRGLRRARLSELEQHGSRGGWAVAATLETALGPVELGTGSPERDPEAQPATDDTANERRVVRIDGRTVRSQTALADHLAMVWLTPQMDRLFLEGASGRRRFFDRLVFAFDPAHAGRLSRYERALRERGRLLRQGGADPAWLAGLESEMAATGVAVTAARVDLLARLQVACAAADGPFPQPGLALAGELPQALARQPALMVEDGLRSQLAASRRIDGESGGAAAGPHRDDLVVSWPESDGSTRPAALCSTGEQKALLIALILAHARLLAEGPSGPPILLLDEVAAHLDGNRRSALYQAILGLRAQAWLTGTDEHLFHALGHHARWFTIEAARVIPHGQE